MSWKIVTLPNKENYLWNTSYLFNILIIGLLGVTTAISLLYLMGSYLSNLLIIIVSFLLFITSTHFYGVIGKEEKINNVFIELYSYLAIVFPTYFIILKYSNINDYLNSIFYIGFILYAILSILMLIGILGLYIVMHNIPTHDYKYTYKFHPMSLFHFIWLIICIFIYYI